MDLTHRFTVPTPVEETWAHFQDLGALAECFPGATIGDYDEQNFSGTVKVKLGPIALVYTGSGTFVQKDESAHRFVVDAKGKDKRGNGTAGAKVTLAMEDSGGSTDVEVLTDLNVTGKPAQFGRGVMQDVSDKLLGQFVACLEKTLSAGPGEVPAAAPGPGSIVETPAATSAGDEAQGEAAAVAVSPAASGAEDPGVGRHAAAGTTGVPTGPRAVPAPPRASPRPTAVTEDDALDLGAAVIPVLIRTYGPQAAISLLVAVLAYLLGRRR